jgi:Astacin (Peptidase family M12A)
MGEPIVCRPKSLPEDQLVAAARTAIKMNPLNQLPMARLAGMMEIPREKIAAVTSKYWRSGGVLLTVQFLDNPEAALRKKILSNMNAWGTRANVRFTETKQDSQVRIAREGGLDGGYWSYVGTDILHITAGQPTMNLEGFTLSTPDSEFHRVVRHETGHTMGFPHEHMRKELVDKIDVQKALVYFRETQGWSDQEIRQQVLTPINEASLLGTEHADGRSIMCYQLPGSITKDGKPIIGGLDIDETDYTFAAKLYPPKKIRRRSADPAVADEERGATGGVFYFAPGTDPDYIADIVNALEDEA